jgi:hypothetical protein
MWSSKSNVVPETGEFSRRLQTTRRTSPRSVKTITKKKHTRAVIHPITDVKKEPIKSMSDESYSSYTIEQLNNSLKVTKDALKKTLTLTLKSKQQMREDYYSINDMKYLNNFDKIYLRNEAIKLNREMMDIWKNQADSLRHTINKLEKQISKQTTAGTRKRRKNKKILNH